MHSPDERLPAGAGVHVVELNGSGHRLYYVRLIADYALRQGHRVSLTLPADIARSPEFSTHIAPFEGRVRFLTARTLTLAQLAEQARQIDASVTVVPDGDRLVYAIARGGRWLGPGQLSLLAMREHSEPRRTRLSTSAATAVKRLAFWRTARSDRVKLSVLGSATQPVSSSSNRVADPVTFVGSQSGADALRRELGIGPSEFVFAIVGAIDERKNVGMVLEALAAASPEVTAKAVLLLAGRVSPGVRQAIEAPIRRAAGRGVRTVVVDEVLDDHRFDSSIALADAVVLAHSNDGPSGILGKAAAAGTRVLAAGSQTLRRDCRRIGNGAHWTKLTPEALRDGLATIRTSPRPTPVILATADQFAASLLRV